MKPYEGLEAWSPRVPKGHADTTDAQILTAAMGWAILAPSGHNSQPWKLRQHDNVVEVRADRSKRLPVVDPNDRELIMSCAALTTHLELALAGLNRVSQTDWLPPDGSPDMVARVKVLGKGTPTTDDLTLFKAIPFRVTNRAPFRPLQIGVEVLLTAKHLVESHGAHLTFLTGETRAATADLIAQGDRTQMADKTFRHELASWVHHNHSDHLEGMRGYGFGVGDLTSHVGPTIIRTFDAGKGQAARDHQLATESPVLVLIETDGDEPIDWICAGRAVDVLLLHLTARGCAASFLNQPIEVPALRAKLAATVGSERHPQLLLRVGEPITKQPHSPRRPLTSITEPAP